MVACENKTNICVVWKAHHQKAAWAIMLYGILIKSTSLMLTFCCILHFMKFKDSFKEQVCLVQLHRWMPLTVFKLTTQEFGWGWICFRSYLNFTGVNSEFMKWVIFYCYFIIPYIVSLCLKFLNVKVNFIDSLDLFFYWIFTRHIQKG